ncbi:MAG: threonine--tRNA ligase, partial [Gammaproteobacteria bacterium]|nr:threonine--tRNA ligase [Gammaproteobacteria bacterium]
KIGYKIREQTLQRVPFLLVAGSKEIKAGAIAIRSRDGEDLGVLPLDQALRYLQTATQTPDFVARREAQQRLCARLGAETHTSITG